MKMQNAEFGLRIVDFSSSHRGKVWGKGKQSPLDEILSAITLNGPSVLAKKVLFRGEGTGGIASYMAGWLAGKVRKVIVLDGANRFDPYMVSTFAKKSLTPPERLLKKIQIARAFTCYQMANLLGEKLSYVLDQEEGDIEMKKQWVILLGPITTFLDEDVPEREAHLLFERSLRRIEEMVLKGISFLLFQPDVFSHSRQVYFLRKLYQFSDLVWKISLENQEIKVLLEKGWIPNYSLNLRPKIRVKPPAGIHAKQILITRRAEFYRLCP